MIVLDTTVLVYALGADHPLRNRATDLLAAIADGRLRGTTTPEVIQEFAHVRARRRGRQDAAGAAATYADLLSPLVEVGEGDLREGLRLFEGAPGLGTFDAVLAAVARRAGARALVSADRAFGAVEGLAWQDLRSADAAALD